VPCGPGTSRDSTRAPSRRISGCAAETAPGVPATRAGASHLDDIDAGRRGETELGSGHGRVGLDIGKLDARGLADGIEQLGPGRPRQAGWGATPWRPRRRPAG